MDQDDLSAVILHQLSSLLADRIRHNDHRLISLYRADKSQADPLVSTGRLYDNRVLMNKPFLLGCFNHIHCCARLDGPAYIHRFELYQNFCLIRPRHPVQADEGSISHCF